MQGVALMSGKFRRATTDDEVAAIIRRGVPGTAMQASTSRISRPAWSSLTLNHFPQPQLPHRRQTRRRSVMLPVAGRSWKEKAIV